MANLADKVEFDPGALIAPLGFADFFREHWERNPLHLPRDDAHYYDRVLTNADLDGIISSADLRYPAIQLAKNGSYLSAEAYTTTIKHGSESFTGVPDLRLVQSEYRSGATVVLPALQRTWAPLRRLCAALEDQFSHPVHANAYLTPGASPGFTPHYDTHEVLVLQIAGSKRWQIFPPSRPLPHRSQTFTPVGYVLPAPLLELELNPGDFLYLPRGYVHAAHTSQGHSAHVTIGITVYTWIELFGELANAAKEVPELRVALPPGFAAREETKETLWRNLVQQMSLVPDNIDGRRFIEGFLQKISSARARPQEDFSSAATVIGLQTRLKTPEASNYRLLTESGRVMLDFAGKRFALPDHIRVTIDEMCKRRSFRLVELQSPLGTDGRLTLARYLYGEGFLTPAD